METNKRMNQIGSSISTYRNVYGCSSFWIFLRLSFCFVSSSFLFLFITLDRLGSYPFLHNHDLKGRFVFLQVALPALTEIYSIISSEIEFFGKKIETEHQSQVPDSEWAQHKGFLIQWRAKTPL